MCLYPYLKNINTILIGNDGYVTINTQITSIKISDKQQNTPCVIDNKFYALWDMRNNNERWDDIDIACGISHEMLHCAQIRYGVEKKCSTELFFSSMPTNHQIVDNGYFETIPESVRNTIEIEGIASYFELYCKSVLKKVDIIDLIDNYRSFSCKNPKMIPYYIGTYRVYSMILAGKFDWDSYFSGKLLFFGPF